MACQSVPHMHKDLFCAVLEKFISVTKEIQQRKKTNGCRLDEVLHFKEDGCTKSAAGCCLSFNFASMKCYLVLFLYYQLIIYSF